MLKKKHLFRVQQRNEAISNICQILSRVFLFISVLSVLKHTKEEAVGDISRDEILKMASCKLERQRRNCFSQMKTSVLLR